MSYDAAKRAVLDKIDRRIRAIQKELGIAPRAPAPRSIMETLTETSSIPESVSTFSLTPKTM
jgi:hypothetical protein